MFDQFYKRYVRAFTSENCILSYFTIPKSYFINYIISFYNTPNIPKLYFFPFYLFIFLLFLFFSSFSSLSLSTFTIGAMSISNHAKKKKIHLKAMPISNQAKKKKKQSPLELRRPQTKPKPSSNPNPPTIIDPNPRHHLAYDTPIHLSKLIT